MPALKDGKAVKAEMRLPVKFVLDQAELLNKRPIQYDLSLDDYKISPNPSKGQLNLQFKGEAKPIKLRIFDLSGKLVFAAEEDYFTGFYQQTIDLTNQGSGTYFLQISQEGKAFTDKLVIQ